MTGSHDIFVLGRGMWMMMSVIYGFVLFIGVGFVVDVLGNSNRDGALFAALWSGALLVAGWSIFFRMPRRLEIVGEGLRFVAPTRTVLIPWGSLLTVSSPRTDINRLALRWTWDGRTLRTWGPYDDDLDRLLQRIRQHAPETDLSRAVTRRPTWGISFGRKR